MRQKKLFSLMLAGAMLLSGCSAAAQTEKTVQNQAQAGISVSEASLTAAASSASESSQASAGLSSAAESSAASASSDSDAEEEEEQSYFSDRDLSGEVDTENAVSIVLNGDSIEADAEGVTVSGSTVTITAGGTYILSGTLTGGSVIVNAADEKVQLVLNGVTIHSDDFAAIYVAQADKVFVTLAEDTVNTLSNGGSFTQIDDSNVDAVIFSRDDITFNGTGSLIINSPAGRGIVGKDEVTITNGSYEITSSGTSIRANDSIAIADGSFIITTDSDGLHAENKDDDTYGSVYIMGGTFEINAGDDGIHAETTLTIDGGTFEITAAEGLEATCVTVNDGELSISASDDGINAALKSSSFGTPTVEINGGDITIVMGSGDTDGVDANGNIVINGGTIDVTGTSTFDYDYSGVINGGTVIANGQQITTLPSQMMGGQGGMNGQMGMNGGMKGGRGMR